MAEFHGTSGSDSLLGGSGADQLFGYESNDTLRGAGGNDTLHGSDGTDYLDGGAGADSLVGGDNGDYAVYRNASAALYVDLGNPANNTGEAAGDSYSSIDRIMGSAFNDTLVGNSEDNGLRGGLGADRLDGGAGFDTASYWDATAGVLADLGNAANNTGEAAGDSYLSIEALVGGAFDDTLVGDGGNNFLQGGQGADSLAGGAGVDHADYINSIGPLVVDLGNSANNTGEAAGDSFLSIEGIRGSAFNDTLAGDGNANFLLGGSGNDSLLGGDGADTIEGDLHDDTIKGNQSTDFVSGGLGNDWLEGNAGADTVDGGAGSDTLWGGGNVDIAFGGNGADWLEMNSGFDTMVGGGGNDTLVGGQVGGGAGTDVFRYDATSLNTNDVAANTGDWILNAQNDLISMLGLTDELLISGVALSALTSETMIGNTLAANTSIAFAGGALQIDLDGNGVFSAASDFQIRLPDITAISFDPADDLLHLA